MMKRFRTIICLLLVFSVFAAFLTGCNNPTAEETEVPSDEATPSEGSDPETSPEEPEMTYDYETASKLFPDDELIMTINGSEVYWKEYFYWLKYAISYLDSYYGPIEWGGEMESLISGDTIKMEDSVLELANDMPQYYRVVEAYAKELGVEISDEDMQGYKDSMLEYYGGEEEIEADMELNYLTQDIAIYMSMVNDMYTKAFESLYDADGAKVTDEEVAKYAEDNGYAQAMHILFMNTDEEGTALGDAEVAEKKATAEEVLEKINDYSGDDIEEYFKELADEYNEDTGQSSYPDGYLYPAGTMVTQFEEAVNSMEDYEVSDIVESDYGYHIIMKLPINYEASPAGDTNGYTLKYYAAYQLFSDLLQEMTKEVEVEYTDAYNSIDPATLFVLIEVEAVEDTTVTDTADGEDSDAETSGTDE